MLAWIRCLFGRHQPDRQRIWHDSLDFRSTCAGCGLPMLRDFDGWRLFEDEFDLDASRTAKPSR